LGALTHTEEEDPASIPTRTLELRCKKVTHFPVKLEITSFDILICLKFVSVEQFPVRDFASRHREKRARRRKTLPWRTVSQIWFFSLERKKEAKFVCKLVHALDKLVKRATVYSLPHCDFAQADAARCQSAAGFERVKARVLLLLLSPRFN
jgi:hypothetical protein